MVAIPRIINTGTERKQAFDALPFLDAPLKKLKLTLFEDYDYTSVRTPDVTVPPHYQGGMICLTNTSMIHPYDLGDNVLKTPWSIHCPKGAFTLPQNIQEYLKNLGIPPERIHLHIVGQNMPWRATTPDTDPHSTRPLYRPHYAYHTLNSDNEHSVGTKTYRQISSMFMGIFPSKMHTVAFEGIPTNTLSKLPIPFYSHSEPSGMIVSSYAAPHNPPINGLEPTKSSSFFSVCLAPDKERCDVTLHLLLNDSDFACINEMNNSDALLTLRNLITELCQLKAKGKLDLLLFDILELFIGSPDMQELLSIEFTNYINVMIRRKDWLVKTSTEKVQQIQARIAMYMAATVPSSTTNTVFPEHIVQLRIILDRLWKKIVAINHLYPGGIYATLRLPVTIINHDYVANCWRQINYLHHWENFFKCDNELTVLLAIDINAAPATVMKQLIDTFHNNTLLIEEINSLITTFRRHLDGTQNNIHALNLYVQIKPSDSNVQRFKYQLQLLKQQVEYFERRLEANIKRLKSNETMAVSIDERLKRTSRLRFTRYELVNLLDTLIPFSAQNVDASSHSAHTLFLMMKKLSTNLVHSAQNITLCNRRRIELLNEIEKLTTPLPPDSHVRKEISALSSDTKQYEERLHTLTIVNMPMLTVREALLQLQESDRLCYQIGILLTRHQYMNLQPLTLQDEQAKLNLLTNPVIFSPMTVTIDATVTSNKTRVLDGPK